MKNIVLVGFMGTGKSAVGRALSKELDRPFVDIDDRIEAAAGQTIAEIFAEFGEAHFRELETQAITEAAQQEGQVIATGGGALLKSANAALLKHNGTLVCLRATVSAIVARTQAAKGARPLLEGPDAQARILELLDDRKNVYAQADFEIDTSELSVDEVTAAILKQVVDADNA